MKQGRFISVVALALCLVVGIGILYSTLYAGCYCYDACWACIGGECHTYDDGGTCFCSNNPCDLDEHHICCVNNPI